MAKARDRASDLTRQPLVFSRRQMLEMKVADINSLATEVENNLYVGVYR